MRATEVEICRKTLSIYYNQKITPRELACFICEICSDLTRLQKNPNIHATVKLMAYKLKNITCKSEDNHYRIERVVISLAQLDSDDDL